MAAAFTMLLAKIAAVVKWFGDLAVKVFEACWDMFRDLWCWPFEQILTIAAEAIEALDLSEIQQYAQAAGDLPSEIMNILGLLGAGTCAGIIVAAITIRLILQLIPFTRLGS